MSFAKELDSLLAEDLSDVCERENSALDRILREHQGRCVLFGAGSLGRSILRCLLQDDIRPIAISDNNPAIWNSRIEGIPVISPMEAVRLHGAGAAFFVTIWSEGHGYGKTHTQLTSLAARHVYPVAPLRWRYAEEFMPFLCQDLPHKVYEESELVRQAFQLWADDRSRDEFLRQLRFRALGDYLAVGAREPETSYFLDSIYSLCSDEVFVDCGAYDGDTIREVLRRQGDAFSKIIALEPDPENFRAAAGYLSGLRPETAARIELHPFAAADRLCQVRLTANGNMGSAISDGDGVLIDAVPLDGLIHDSAPTFIKMDIEGAEADALKGCRNLIAQHHPILAICLYHRQSDLWRIPLLIHSLYPEYRYFLRAHEEDGWQTVGYAIPPERLKSVPSADSSAVGQLCPVS